METASGVADARHQLPLDETVHVLVSAADPGRFLSPAFEDRVESVGDGRRIRGVEDAGARERFRPREAAGHVVFEQAAIERERNAEIKRRGIGRRIESSGP